MATRIKLRNFIGLNGQSKQTVADKTNRNLKTVYNWLADNEAEYIVFYDARSNNIKKVERHAIKRVDGLEVAK